MKTFANNIRDSFIEKGLIEITLSLTTNLIDVIISEAKELGIETLPPRDLEALKNSWKAHRG